MPTRCNDDVYMISERDIMEFEEKLQGDPYSVRIWLEYVYHKNNGTFAERCFTYERAVKILPGSYRLWKDYLDFRRDKLKGASPVKYMAHYAKVNQCYENSLLLLNKMPRIWLDYLEFLMQQSNITFTRRTFDRALRALPLSQHSRVWQLYQQFAEEAGGETARRIFRRYLTFEPTFRKNYVKHLKEMGYYREAVEHMMNMIKDDTSKLEITSFELWMDLCDILAEHGEQMKDIKVEAVMRTGIKRFIDQTGLLYCNLATYWIKMGQLVKARDVFEEGITTVKTVRDFTTIFDAYCEFEEELTTAKLEAAAEREQNGEVDEYEDRDSDMCLLRLDRLMDRRPFLVNNVLLRQNPNNVSEWEKRVELWGENKEKVVQTYTEAVQTISPKQVSGKLQELWAKFARFYEDGGDLDSARAIFEKATKVNFKNVDDLADVWCEYAEMELRHDNFDLALEVMARATITPKLPGVNSKQISFYDESLPVQQRVFKCLKLWSFYVDLEESVGSVESTKAVYDKIMELRIANPQTIVNYATFLQERQYFEESFKVYERGIELFGWPIAFDLWNIYLPKFVDRYGGTKLERARDLYEQALNKCPPKYAKPLYLSFADLEEQHGLARHAMRIYDRATSAVADEDRLEMFKVYIAKATESFGLPAAREIYEKSLEALPDKDVRPMSLQYADLERKLGEIDRARAIYGYASQFFDPKTEPTFWQIWNDFEVKHGNEDTFKEMLRIKRSVQAQFSSH